MPNNEPSCFRLYFIKDTNGWREQMTNRTFPTSVKESELTWKDPSHLHKNVQHSPKFIPWIFLEETRPGFKVMPVRSQPLHDVPSKIVGFGDNTIRPFAKRLEKVGGVGRSDKQEGRARGNRNHIQFWIASSWSRTQDIAAEAFTWCDRNKIEIWSCLLWGTCPKTQCFFGHCGHQKALCCCSCAINASTMVWCLYCQVLEAMGMQRYSNTASAAFRVAKTKGYGTSWKYIKWKIKVRKG